MNDLPSPAGHNLPPLSLPHQIRSEEDLPTIVTEYLGEEFGRFQTQVTGLLDEARVLPKVIETDDDMGKAADVVKRLRDLTREIESTHAAEKAPYLRSGQSCDSFFFTLWDKCAKRSKTANPGAADILQARLDDFAQRKYRAEQARRDENARKAREEAEEAARQQATARIKAEDDRLAAERARKPETAAAKGAVADLSEANASAARIEAEIAADRAQQAHIENLAKPADLVRTRTESGAMMTMAREGYAVITDESALDKSALWPFISEKEKEKALRSWAKNTGYNKPMDGAEIGFRNKTVIR